MGPPQPFTIWSRPPKGHGTPQLFTTWSGAPRRQGWDPPNPSRFGAAPQKDKDWTPPQPFTIWHQKHKDWTPNPSRLGVAPNTRQHSLTESPLLLPASAKTASQKAHMRTRQHSLRKPIASSSTRQDSLTERPRQRSVTESPIQTGTDSRKAHMQCCLFLHNSRQHSLTQSPLLLPASARTASQKVENPPTRPHRKPNPERDKLTSSQKGHMQCRVQSCLGPVEGNDPRRLCRSPRLGA